MNMILDSKEQLIVTIEDGTQMSLRRKISGALELEIEQPRQDSETIVSTLTAFEADKFATWIKSGALTSG